MSVSYSYRQLNKHNQIAHNSLRYMGDLSPFSYMDPYVLVVSPSLKCRNQMRKNLEVNRKVLKKERSVILTWERIWYGFLCLLLATGIILFTLAYFEIDPSHNVSCCPIKWSLFEILTIGGAILTPIGVMGLLLLYVWYHLDELYLS